MFRTTTLTDRLVDAATFAARLRTSIVLSCCAGCAGSILTCSFHGRKCVYGESNKIGLALHTLHTRAALALILLDNFSRRFGERSTSACGSCSKNMLDRRLWPLWPADRHRPRHTRSSGDEWCASAPFPAAGKSESSTTENHDFRAATMFMSNAL
jgi:hypothetical protein